MNAISVRPPQGNAVAYWGRRHLIRAELKPDLPHASMIGQQLAIHQGKRWDDDARARASEYATLLPDYRVSLAPEGYRQGIVCVATLAAIIDFTGTARPGVYGRLGALTLHMVEDRGLSLIDEAEVPEITDHATLEGVLVTQLRSFPSRVEVAQFGLAAVEEVRRWGDPTDGVVWVLRDVIKFANETPCNGRSGVFQLPRQIANSVRARVRSR